MLSRKIFEKGLTEIETVFHAFEMTKERADIWYTYSKDLTDSMWQKKIANCIKGCRKIPTLADILDIKSYYADHSKEYNNFEPPEEEPEKSVMPEWFKKRFKIKNIPIIKKDKE